MQLEKTIKRSKGRRTKCMIRRKSRNKHIDRPRKKEFRKKTEKKGERIKIIGLKHTHKLNNCSERY